MTDDNSGLWRDRSFLFVQRDRARFPALCLKCGDFADSDGDEYTCIYFPAARAHDWLETLCRGNRHGPVRSSFREVANPCLREVQSETKISRQYQEQLSGSSLGRLRECSLHL